MDSSHTMTGYGNPYKNEPMPANNTKPAIPVKPVIPVKPAIGAIYETCLNDTGCSSKVCCGVVKTPSGSADTEGLKICVSTVGNGTVPIG